MGWLETHLTEFVEPVLGEDFDRSPLGYFSPEELTVIKNTWRSVKREANGRPILLPGRDVFIWEILARRENYPTLFMPEVSRMTVRHIKIPNLEDYLLFDTGFRGSIPLGLGIDKPGFKLMSYSNNGGGMWMNEDKTTQVFPRLTFSRGLVLKIETTPKYWQSGRMAHEAGIYVALGRQDPNAKVVQPMANPVEFALAARLTIEVYKNSAPRFVKKHKPILTMGGWY